MNHFDKVSLALATLCVGAGFLNVPSWSQTLTDPCHLAMLAAVPTMVAFYVTRFFGKRGMAVERQWAALFLAAMPLVYIAGWFRSGASGLQLVLELIAFIFFAAVAWKGFKSNPLWLPAGIAAHGLIWDLWHLFLSPSSVPHWYSLDCLLADSGLALYLVLRIKNWPPSFSGRNTSK